MTVVYKEDDLPLTGGRGFIPPDGVIDDVGGGLVCSADAPAQGVSGCAWGYLLPQQVLESRVSESGEVSFPLDVHIRPNPGVVEFGDSLIPGHYSVPVSFVFEEA
ncbi:hypothetical protein MC149_004104 [Salmonella enterica]|nr:hypothetical protein [Salmonella enterica subsp. enterica serovar Gaminara]EGT2786633.1 hypothetical protein [Salmonella enterica subsp. enterica serovar Carmel]EIV7027864.1 hypothetical protein [Salmonella enterica]EIW3704177.1 hypothetical protein [Salmonella enterica]ELX2876551.1 hypothetical protein [Salmonella enterica]